MANKEEIVLDLSVDQGSMITELERTKSVIIGLKKEQQDLAKAYKAGQINQEEYAKELVRVEGILKTTQSQYNKTQQAVTGVKTKMDDLVKSNKDLSKSFEQNINNATVFGTNIGGLKASITAMTTGVGGAIAAITALGAIYARSSNGAKDLEFAQNQLAGAFGIVANNIGNLVGSDKDGEGPLSKFLNIVLKTSIVGLSDRLGFTDIIEGSKESALAIERLQDLVREEIGVRAIVSDRLADNQELMSKIQDSQTQYNDKAHLTTEIISNLSKNEDELLAVKQKQIAELEEQKKSAKDVEGIDTKILEIGREMSNIQKDAARKIEGIHRLESNLLDTENKRLETNKKISKEKQLQQSEIEREKRIRDLENDLQSSITGIGGERIGEEITPGSDPQEKINAKQDKNLNKFISVEKKKRVELKKTNEAYKQYVTDQLQMAEDNFNGLANLFSQGSDARRAFGLAAIGVDTAEAISALTAASEANPANAVTFGGAAFAQYAAGLIRIFTNIAAAKEFLGGNFAGGADFVTSKPTMIMVGDNPGNRERVTVEPLSGRGKSNFNKNAGLANFAGGGSITFDPVSSAANASVTQALASANAIKRMPRPIVGVKQIVKEMDAVKVKQNVSKR